MRNETNDKAEVLGFLESAGTAALESRRLRRMMDGLGEQQGQLRLQKGAAVRTMARLLGEEQERTLAAAKKELESYRKVEAFLNRIPDGTHRTILRRRYLDVGLNWTEIRDRLAEDGLYYSERHIIRLHTQAVEAARMLWEREREEGESEKRR